MKGATEYLEWRFWVGVCLPTLIAWAVVYFTNPSPGLVILLFSFLFVVVPSFTRHMARSQARANLRSELRRLNAEFFNVADMVNQMPYEESQPYLEGLHLMEFRIRVLESVLESKK
jgi:hypothetical protein